MTRPPEVKSLVGYTIGKCVLQRICGRGAMGTVYQGMHTGLDIDVAVKVLPPHLSSNTSLVQRFLREAKLAAKLNHVNTVRVYDVGEESGYYYLVMEFVKGNDALDLVKTHGPLDAATVADIGAGAAKALAHAHANGVVHRDIKPANLMLPESGGVKVADFGLARATASDSGLTMTGAIMGTPDYMAPEQAQGKQAGASADAYSLGGTLYHLFVGRPPFSASTPMAVALQHVTSRIVVPQDRIKTPAERGLAQIIHELTEKEPDARLVDMNVVSDRLIGIARQSRSTTQKLMSEGATLFATAGFRIDTRAIEKAKMDAIAEMHALIEADEHTSQAPTAVPKRPPTRSNPMLDELRKVGAEVSSQARALRDDNPGGLTQDLADLTPEMVREAKAKAKRSSGSLPALGPSAGESPRRSSGRLPAINDASLADAPPRVTPTKRSSGHLPPITDDLPVGSSRRNKVAAGSNVEDHGWQEYAAKSFPTLGRKAIGEGETKAPDSIPAPWDGKPHSGETRTMYAETRREERRRSSGSGIGMLLVLIVLGAGVYGGWYFFLRNKNANQNTGPEAITSVNLVVNNFQAHKDGTQVFALAGLRDGKSMLSAGLDGSVHLWREPFEKPLASYTDTKNQIRFLAPNVEDGKHFAASGADGRIMLFNSETVKISNGDLFGKSVVNISALHWPKSGVIAGDDKGRLWKKDMEPIVLSKSQKRITAIASRSDSLYVGTAGGEIFLCNINTLAVTTTVQVQDGSIDALVAGDKGVFAIVKGALRALGASGLGPEYVSVSGVALSFTIDGVLLVALTSSGISYIDPVSLKVVGSKPAPDSGVACIGQAPGAHGAGVGTSSGRVFRFVHQP